MNKHKQNKGEIVMGKIQEKRQKGFTIIEVVLVLAIAGLIFLIVFLAVPALQRNRRDTQRRSDAARFMSQAESFSSNRNGSYPTGANLSTFISDNLDNFKDPSSGATYTVAYDAAPATLPSATAGEAVYSISTKCAADGQLREAAGLRNIALIMRLESKDLYCVDNQ
jgi:prepilin-type N-terminal cleavage/methylation domain-containing protein